MQVAGGQRDVSRIEDALGGRGRYRGVILTRAIVLALPPCLTMARGLVRRPENFERRMQCLPYFLSPRDSRVEEVGPFAPQRCGCPLPVVAGPFVASQRFVDVLRQGLLAVSMPPPWSRAPVGFVVAGLKTRCAGWLGGLVDGSG